MLDLINELKEELKGDQDKLTALLDIENEIREKKYGLVWEEHEEAVDKELETKIPVFKEDKDREIKLGDEKVNFILEGDNLHSLYLLEKTHRGKIDVIYIDPPYNTGKNDFKYGDKMIDEDDGYRHSKWLSFMSKRLEIARELLTDEGVIFISIDDREYANLKLLCDSIFGEKNFINNIVIQTSSGANGPKSAHVNKTIVKTKEYLLVYAKDKKNINYFKPLYTKKKEMFDPHFRTYIHLDTLKAEPLMGVLKRDQVIIDSMKGLELSYKNLNLVFNSNYKLYKYFLNKYRYNVFSDSPYNKKIKDNVLCKLNEGAIVLYEDDLIYKTRGGKGNIRKYIPLDKSIKKTDDYIVNIVDAMVLGDVWDFTEDMSNLGKEGGVEFTNGKKPLRLLRNIMKLCGDKNLIILDFFAGSGTTGQAVLELNKEDGGNRTFILCTNNEVGEKKEKEFKKKYGNKEDYPEEWLEWEEKYGIARSITYERMRKVIEGYTTPKGKEIEGISANLKYYKTDYIEKENPEDDDYEIEEEILKYVIELIQLEYGIDISNKEIGLILSDMYGNLDEEYNVTKITKKRLDEIKVLYVAEGLLLPDNLEDKLKERGIEIKWVPRYYNFN